MVKVVIKDDDGMGWFEDGEIVINVRWSSEDSIVDDISYTFIHEYIEHVLRLGHDKAVKAEKLIREAVRRG